MLQQNWFYQPNMEMFHEYYNRQEFFDNNTKNIYVVEEDDGGHTIITEILENHDNYGLHYCEYLEWKSDNMPVKMFLDEIRKFFCSCSDEEMDELYETGTIDISMFGLTTKIPFAAEPYNKIVDALKSLVDGGEVK